MGTSRKMKGESARLLAPNERESAFTRTPRKKGIFSGFRKKKEVHSYQPFDKKGDPSTPMTLPDITLEPLDDHETPYTLLNQKTISGLTIERGDATAQTPRRVGFALQKEMPPPPKASGTVSPVETLESGTSMLASHDSKAGDGAAAFKKGSTGSVCSNGFMSQTLGIFDEICHVPKSQQRKKTPVGGASRNVDGNDSIQRPWGTVPSESFDSEAVSYTHLTLPTKA